MKQSYSDIIGNLGEPLWWDEVGCPRYESFHPSLVNNIYASEACLFTIFCQSCHHNFHVCLTWQEDGKRKSIKERIKRNNLHYGDPPNYCCQSGATMNSVFSNIIQFWERAKGEWVRVENYKTKPGVKRPI